MAVHYVLKDGDIPTGGHAVIEVEGKQIGVYRLEDQYVAILNYCPHQGAPMCSGSVVGTNLPSGVYEYDYGRAGEIIRCPWHGWEFDLRTGKSLFSDKTRVKKYDVVVDDGKIGIVIGKD